MTFGLHTHGGFCCGVTHLYLGGVYGPEVNLPQQKAFNPILPQETGVMYNGYQPNYDGRREALGGTLYRPKILHSKDQPVQTAGERVDQELADYVRRHRSAGVIEVAITNSQRPGWDSFLTERGFVEVGNSRNSNTQRRIHMYMLFYDGFDNLAKPIKDAVSQKRRSAAAPAEAEAEAVE